MSKFIGVKMEKGQVYSHSSVLPVMVEEDLDERYFLGWQCAKSGDGYSPIPEKRPYMIAKSRILDRLH